MAESDALVQTVSGASIVQGVEDPSYYEITFTGITPGWYRLNLYNGATQVGQIDRVYVTADDIDVPPFPSSQVIDNFGLAVIPFSHNGAVFTPEATQAGSSHVPYWRPYGTSSQAEANASYSQVLAGGAGSGNVIVGAWSCTALRFDGDGITEIDLSQILGLTTGLSMFQGCALLTEVEGVESLSGVTDTSYMFAGCTVLAAASDLSSMSNVLNATQMFFNCTSMAGPVDLSGMSALVNGNTMFGNCAGVTGTPDLTAMVDLVDATQMFFGCTGITGVPDLTALTSLTTGYSMFYNCISMAGTPDLTELAALTDATAMFYACTSLTGSPDLTAISGITTAWLMFQHCPITNLVLAGASFPSCTNWVDTISNTSVPAATVDLWLERIDATGPLTGTISYQGMAANAHLDSARSPSGLAAKNSLIAKGWVRTGTY